MIATVLARLDDRQNTVSVSDVRARIVGKLETAFGLDGTVDSNTNKVEAYFNFRIIIYE